MANTYYDSELTAEEIEEVLEAINGILTPANNGKVLAISNGKFEARSVQWGGGGSAVLEPLSVTANGDYYPEAGVDGFDEVHVSVSGGSSDGVMVNPSYEGLSYCYVDSSGVSFSTDSQRTKYLLIFPVLAGHKYALYVGETVGNRRRASYFANKTILNFLPYLETQPVETYTIFSDGIWLAPFTAGADDTGNALTGRIIYTPSMNGVIVYQTNNAGQTIKAYCADMSASGGSAVIQALTVTQNGVYNPPSGVDGYAPIAVNVSGGGGGGTIYYGTDNPTSLIGSDGDTYVKYNSGVETKVTVNGGYNGGAEIKVWFIEDVVFSATGSRAYNLNYDNTQADVSTFIGLIHIEVTPPVDSNGELYITVTGPNNSVISNPPKQGPNTSYGYGSYENIFLIVGDTSQRIIRNIFIKQNGIWKCSGDSL